MPQRPPRQRLSSNALIAINSRIVGNPEVEFLQLVVGSVKLGLLPHNESG